MMHALLFQCLPVRYSFSTAITQFFEILMGLIEMEYVVLLFQRLILLELSKKNTSLFVKPLSASTKRQIESNSSQHTESLASELDFFSALALSSMAGISTVFLTLMSGSPMASSITMSTFLVNSQSV